MNFAIILAGGLGKRLGAPTPKQYIDINGKPLLYYSIKAFEESGIDKISIVADAPSMKFVLDEIVDKYNFKKVVSVCEGGSERFISAMHGLDDLSSFACDEDIVLIHDGARPFIKPEEINNIIEAVKENGAAIAAMPVKDTIKISKEGSDFVESTTSRANTWQIQTPQGFNYKKIFDAYKQIKLLSEQEKALITDDAMIWEKAYGSSNPVKLVKTSYSNIKITDKGDLEVAKVRLI